MRVRIGKKWLPWVIVLLILTMNSLTRSDDGSAACRLCCPMGESGPSEDKVGNVGNAFVVNRLCNPARSALEEVAVEDNWEPMGRIGEA